MRASTVKHDGRLADQESPQVCSTCFLVIRALVIHMECNASVHRSARRQCTRFGKPWTRKQRLTAAVVVTGVVAGVAAVFGAGATTGALMGAATGAATVTGAGAGAITGAGAGTGACHAHSMVKGSTCC